MPDLSREDIDHSVHGSSRALHSAVRDVLGCVRSAVRHVSCRVGWSSLNSADRDGNGQNDRKQHFHSTKLSFLPARTRLRIFVEMRGRNEDCAAPGSAVTA